MAENQCGFCVNDPVVLYFNLHFLKGMFQFPQVLNFKYNSMVVLGSRWLRVV